MKKMQLRHQVGALFVVGLESTEVSALEQAWLRVVQPGGIILFKRNLASPRQIQALWRSVAITRKPAQNHSHVREDFFRCVDLEGGTVDRLRDWMGPTPSAAAVAATGDAKLFHQHGARVGQMLAALGFNVDLAPVLDLALPASRAVMGSRTASYAPRMRSARWQTSTPSVPAAMAARHASSIEVCVSTPPISMSSEITRPQ